MSGRQRSDDDAVSASSLGALICLVRWRRGWSQADLAERLAQAGLAGVDRNQVSRWEREVRIPVLHTRERLAIALEIDPERLEKAADVSRAARLNQADADPDAA